MHINEFLGPSADPQWPPVAMSLTQSSIKSGIFNQLVIKPAVCHRAKAQKVDLKSIENWPYLFPLSQVCNIQQ